MSVLLACASLRGLNFEQMVDPDPIMNKSRDIESNNDDEMFSQSQKNPEITKESRLSHTIAKMKAIDLVIRIIMLVLLLVMLGLILIIILNKEISDQIWLSLKIGNHCSSMMS